MTFQPFGKLGPNLGSPQAVLYWPNSVFCSVLFLFFLATCVADIKWLEIYWDRLRFSVITQMQYRDLHGLPTTTQAVPAFVFSPASYQPI